MLLLITLFITSIVNGHLSDIQKWREIYQPELINPLDPGLEYEYKKGYVYIHSFDKQKNPVIYFNASNYDKNDRKLADVKLLTIYILDSALKLSNGDKFVIIVDLDRFSLLKTLDFEIMKMVINMLQTSDILELAIAINAHAVFQTCWSVIKIFISDQTKSKVKFYNDKKDLINIVEYENLPNGFRAY